LVTYQYQFNQKTYQNNKVFLVDLLGGQANHSSPDFVQPYVDQIANPCIIYVNPKNPQESIIFRDGIMLYIAISFLGFLAFCMAIFYIYLAFAK